MVEPAIQGNLDPEVRKNLEFIYQWAEATPHLASMMEQDFAQNPEGKLVAYLKHTVLEGYIRNNMSFLQHIVAGEPGRRGVHGLIHYLENPQNGEAKDETLIKSMKKLADEIEKAKMPDLNELRHFKALEKALREMKTDAYIPKFKEDFESMLARATAYPEAGATKIIVKNSVEFMPKRHAMENYRTAIMLWKLVYSKLITPPETGHELNEFEKKLAEQAKKSVDDFRKECGLPNMQETKGWDNFTALKNISKSSLIINIFNKLGQGSAADDILLNKIRNMNHEQFLHELKGMLNKMGSESEISKVEMAAAKESADIIARMIEVKESAIKKEHDKFIKAITKSIEDIESSHNKNLKIIEDMKKEEEVTTQNYLMHSTIAAKDLEEIGKVDDSIRGFGQRMLDMTNLMLARLKAQDFVAKTIDVTTFTNAINGMITEEMDSFFVDSIKKIRDAARSSPEEFQQILARTDKVLEALREQIPQLTGGMNRMAEKQVELADEYEDMRDGSRYWLDESERLAKRDRRRLSRMNLDYERYHDEFSDDEMDYLNYN